MQRQYKRLAHSLWFCKYHIVFCPKYRYTLLTDEVEVLVRNTLYKLCGQKEHIEIETINIQPDHIHMVMTIPPKYAVSELMGFLKGKTALKLFDKKAELRNKYWGRHIWARGYCVSTVGLNEEQIKKYVKWQQKQEQKG